ncbi:MurR/RpiR family transcriptional regulator [Desulfosarcina sp.]|uniref:MurR/RpiR family transcriptional regulator n=1 Tax=Desulfosarcina sp. TaxID=2027861 RepID=UPI0029A09CEA|nr:MurR/RpiR family transcriptional regulator [Desulfosarcina sp.]MDX2453475.1 MurR/RpiR family transcriptional regulator [Desulfosarcina sp.]MDX2491189.1 MurR/RpiR family transcriptional regulator [Desulfosarcina sp.]
MTRLKLHPLIEKISESIEGLTPKGRILGEYIISQPRKAVFMTTKELAEACEVSEATVVRFVSGIGYDRYSDFQQALRDFVDTELTLLDRLDIADMKAPGAVRFRRTVAEEIDNLQQLYHSLDVETMAAVVDVLDRRVPVYVIGSRLSFTLAYYMGWAMTKVRENIHIMKGSDRTTIDWLTIAPADSVVVIIATSRYPNELIRLGKLVNRLGQTLVVITDSATCPVLQFADHNLIAASKLIPFLGSPTPMSCLINYLVHELASRQGDALKAHQARLEQSYWDHDVLFNMKDLGGRTPE